ncbi:hypothetical protein AB4097_21210 [Microvirga sp. 2MCAF35]|uniref:hypothetical protein n=1 Tax=Microvirga sp. 2MCAF35 TaxID=3232987 RepID=UPI003F9E94BB
MTKKLSLVRIGVYSPFRNRKEAEEAIRVRFSKLCKAAEGIKDDNQRASLVRSIRNFSELLPELQGRELVTDALRFIAVSEDGIQISIYGIEDYEPSQLWELVESIEDYETDYRQ